MILFNVFESLALFKLVFGGMTGEPTVSQKLMGRLSRQKWEQADTGWWQYAWTMSMDRSVENLTQMNGQMNGRMEYKQQLDGPNKM